MLEMLLEKLRKGEIRGAAILALGDNDFSDHTMWNAIRAAKFATDIQEQFSTEIRSLRKEILNVNRKSIVGKTIAKVIDDEDGEVKLIMTDGSRFDFAVVDGGNREECYVNYELNYEPVIVKPKTLTQVYQESFGKANAGTSKPPS